MNGQPWFPNQVLQRVARGGTRAVLLQKHGRPNKLGW